MADDTATHIPAYKTVKFWAVTVLTLCGLATASEALVSVPDAVQVVAWVVTLGAALGFRSWGPVADAPKV
jgi:small-conductance mechanosensitive channel